MFASTTLFLFTLATGFLGSSGQHWPLSRWATHGLLDLSCRENIHEEGEPSGASFFHPDGNDFLALLDAYLYSARNYVGVFWRWPLDGTEHVEALVGATFGPVDRDAPPNTPPPPQIPYVMRVDLPLDAKVHVFGDLHGSFHSLLRTLWSLADSGAMDATTLALQGRHFALFLGDYVDRGTYGVETLALLLSFKAANPGKVFMARGNHEDVVMNGGSFREEVEAKFPGEALAPILAAIARVYETIPRALYLGTVDPSPGWCHNGEGREISCYGEGIKVGWRGVAPPPRHLQCVHGGLEVGFNPTPLLWYYNAGASGDTHDGADEGSTVYFALIHGYSRGAWWKGLGEGLKLPPTIPSPLAKDIGKLGLFQDWGHNLEALKNASLPPATLASAPLHPTSLLSAERVARRVSSKKWGKGGAWPLPPQEVNPGCGFMWADFIVSGWKKGGEGLVNARGRGLAWGESLTEDVLGRYGLVGVLRAHQHNDAPASGPMLTRVREGEGAYNNWGREDNGWEGLVTTFLSGAHIPGLHFTRDAHAILHLGTYNPSHWQMVQCSQEPTEVVGEEEVRGAWQEVIEEHLLPLARANGEGAEEEEVDGVENRKRKAMEMEVGWLQERLQMGEEGRGMPEKLCHWRRDFQCRPLLWRPRSGPGGVGGGEGGEWDTWKDDGRGEL